MKESEKQELISETVEIAKSIIAGDADPYEGCAKLGELNKNLDWPKELSAFGLLFHKQYDMKTLVSRRNLVFRKLLMNVISWLPTTVNKPRQGKYSLIKIEAMERVC